MSSAVAVLHPHVPSSTMRDVFDRQLATALRLRHSTARERIARILRLREAVLDHVDEFTRAGKEDFRKTADDVFVGDIVPVAMEANDAARHLESWMAPQRVWPTLFTAGTSSHIQYQPRGRCLVIAPWNFPVNLALGPAISAIAAGNTVIIKPSELTPHMSGVMVKVVRQVFPEDEVAAFEGDADVSRALLELPFDHVFFTGSAAIGKVVMAAAAKHLTSVTLELGGRNPTIIDRTADIKLAAQMVATGKILNGGQACVAPDHLYVHSSVRDAFVTEFRRQVEKALGPERDWHRSPDLTRVVNARHFARVKGLLDDALARGARTLMGGTTDEAGLGVAPTVLENVPADARVLGEEIFAPLLPLITYTDLDEVIARINSEPKALSLYVFSQDEGCIQKVLTSTSSGGVCINHAAIQFAHGNLPFGGVGHSGMGNAHGFYGFRAFSHERGVVRTQVEMSLRAFQPGRLPDIVGKSLRSFVRWL